MARHGGMSVREAARTPRLWLLLVIYAICGFDDFFVSTHVVAFAQDRGVDGLLAGNLLAFMGLTGLIGLLATAFASDRIGPAWTSAVAFAARVAVFGLIAVDQSTLSIAVFALVFGATFLVTAPMTVLFVRDQFGMKHLGALTGLITMVHQIFGGIGAWGGAAHVRRHRHLRRRLRSDAGRVRPGAGPDAGAAAPRAGLTKRDGESGLGSGDGCLPLPSCPFPHSPICPPGCTPKPDRVGCGRAEGQAAGRTVQERDQRQ